MGWAVGVGGRGGGMEGMGGEVKVGRKKYRTPVHSKEELARY
jgi:hypothetical protein